MGHRNFVGRFSFVNTDAVGDVLFTIPLNSLLFAPSDDYTAYSIAPSIYILNQFLRWRADIELEFCSVKTMFHSGRLLATTAYGAPGISPGEENIFNNQVMEISGENGWNSVKIPFNAATEYLRTYEGTGAYDAVQDYSLGTFQVSVANVLRTSSSVVATSVDVVVFAKFTNVQVYGIRPCPNTGITPLSNVPQLFIQGEVANVVAVGEVEGSEASPAVVANTASEAKGQTQKPCSLSIGRKFEYNVKDLHELVRRHKKIVPYKSDFRTTYDVSGLTATGLSYSFQVKPLDGFRSLYATWCGHIKYRIFVSYVNAGLSTPRVHYISCPGRMDNFEYNGGFCEGDAGGCATRDVANGAQSFKKSALAVWEYCVERPYQIGENSWMIDISVPFNSHYNKLPNDETQYGAFNANFTNGRIYVTLPDVETWDISVYEAAGDDFRYMDWCPINLCTTRQYQRIGLATNATTQIIGSSHIST